MDDEEQTTQELWRQAHRRFRQKKLRAELAGGNIRDATEGPIVDQLLYVFSQIDEMKKSWPCES